jgi:hypothetical protein
MRWRFYDASSRRIANEYFNTLKYIDFFENSASFSMALIHKILKKYWQMPIYVEKIRIVLRVKVKIKTKYSSPVRAPMLFRLTLALSRPGHAKRDTQQPTERR